MIDTEHENAVEIKNWFTDNSVELSADNQTVLSIYKDVCYRGKITQSRSVKERINITEKQIGYVRKNIQGLLYKQDESAKTVKSGYVYAVTNPSWEGYVKIGSTIDVYDRLQCYQTYSPHRDYKLVGYVFSEERLKLERLIQNQFPDRKCEWIDTDESSVKKYLQSFEVFPDKEIREFAIKETTRVILEDHRLDNFESERVALRTCLKQLKHSVKGSFPELDQVDLESSKSISRNNLVWSVNGLSTQFRFVDGLITIVNK